MVLSSVLAVVVPESRTNHVSIVLGIIAVTIQFIRCCIEIVRSVSIAVDNAANVADASSTKKLDGKERKSKTPNGQSNANNVSNNNNNNNKDTSGALTAYGSVRTSTTTDTSTITSITNKNGNGERQPLLEGPSSTNRTEKTIPTRASLGANRLVPTIWLLSLIFFTVMWTLELILPVFVKHFLSPLQTTQGMHVVTFDASAISLGGMTVWICFIDFCLYLFCYRSSLMNRARYGPIQQWLRSTSIMFLWCAVTLPLFHYYYYHYDSQAHQAAGLDAQQQQHQQQSLNWFNLVYLVGITTYFLSAVVWERQYWNKQTQTSALLASSTVDQHDEQDAESGLGNFTKEQEKEQLQLQQQQRFRFEALRPLLKPYFWPDATSTSAWANRIRAISTWLCVIGSKVCNLFSPLYLGWASTSLAHGQINDCIKYSVLYCFISWVGSTLREGQSLVYLDVAQAAFVQLSEAAFAHLHSLSLDWHLKKKLGEVLRSMDRGIAACDTLMKYLFLWLVPAMAECIVVCIIFATYFHYIPLAVTVFYFVMIYVVWTIVVTVHRKKYRKALTKHDNDWHDRFTDSMINFETVKYFTAEKYEQQRFKEAVMRYQAGSVNVQASLSFLNISQQIILKLCLAVSLALSAIAIRQRMDCCVTYGGCDSGISDCCQTGVGYDTCSNVGMQVGDFVAVLTYTTNLFIPLNFLGSVYNAVVMAIIDLSNMSELLAENPDVTDAPDAVPLPSLPPPSKNKDDDVVVVEFDNVHFHYPSQPEDRGLKGLSFKMKRGTTTAIVGPTGAGKTTVSRLLFRFYDVLGGSVKIHGKDVRTVTQESVRNMIGVVPQTASMFNDTIRSNLLYGRRSATEDELVQCARDAQLLPFIETLDLQWETLVGDRGLKLSGGERQRAAIARCLLKDPPIVVLDEATSALDTITEKSVQEALDRLGADRTVLVIAHRLGTIRNADNIIVVKDGIAAEQGTHDELLSRPNGIYAEMWNMQLHSSSASKTSSRVDLLSME